MLKYIELDGVILSSFLLSTGVWFDAFQQLAALPSLGRLCMADLKETMCFRHGWIAPPLTNISDMQRAGLGFTTHVEWKDGDIASSLETRMFRMIRHPPKGVDILVVFLT